MQILAYNSLPSPLQPPSLLYNLPDAAPTAACVCVCLRQPEQEAAKVIFADWHLSLH